MKNIALSVFEYDGVLRSAVFGVMDLFEIANRYTDQVVFSVEVINSLSRLPVVPNSILFVPPCLNEVSATPMQNISEQLQEWHEHGVVIAATCASVFWLAEAGLLDGRTATTHWRLYDRLTQQYPAIKAVDRRHMVVDQGSIISAAGLYAFQDLALHLIARYASYNTARQVADFALLDFTGRVQSYYQRFKPRVDHGDSKVLAAQRYCDQTDVKALSVKAIAEQICVSERTLSRRFKQALNLSPGDYIQQMRIERSKQQLEVSELSIQQIADQVGYADLSNFNKAFKRVSGVSPAEYRQRLQV